MVNGKAAVVVQDATAYQQQIEKIEVLEGLAESVAQVKAGQTQDARKAVGELLADLKAR